MNSFRSSMTSARLTTTDGGNAIAAGIDAAQRAPKFNRFGKRFRIGISTFGRARFDTRRKVERDPATRWYRDLTPLDIAINPAFDLQATRNQANELVLSYRANRSDPHRLQRV